MTDTKAVKQPNKVALTLFYDGKCPFCLAEINKLKQLDQQHKINFIDIFSNQFSEYNQITTTQALSKLHGITANNQIITALDVAVKAWQLVGYGAWVAPLTWPPLRPVANLFYRLFLLIRKPLTRLFYPELTCNDQCSKP